MSKKITIRNLIREKLAKYQLGFLFVLFTNTYCAGQAKYELNKNDSLTNETALNKEHICQFNHQITTALSYYPELKNTKIAFRHKKIKTTLACRPDFFSIFKTRKNRTFKIYINTDSSELRNAIFNFIPLEGQIGVIGHELGHIVDYQNKSMFGIISTGFGYLFKGYKTRLEKKVDRITVDHGLKLELKVFCYYIINQSNAPAKYKEYKRSIYYLPEELEKL